MYSYEYTKFTVAICFIVKPLWFAIHGIKPRQQNIKYYWLSNHLHFIINFIFIFIFVVFLVFLYQQTNKSHATQSVKESVSSTITINTTTTTTTRQQRPHCFIWPRQRIRASRPANMVEQTYKQHLLTFPYLLHTQLHYQWIPFSFILCCLMFLAIVPVPVVVFDCIYL